MLTDAKIEKLVRPIATRQEQINIYTTKTIVSKIKKPEYTKADIEEINKDYEDFLEIQIASIIALLTSIASLDMSETYPHIKEDREIKKAVNNVIDNAAIKAKEALSNPMYLIRDLKHPSVLKPATISDAFQSVLQEASQPDVDMTRTVNQLINSGLREVGYPRRLDNAIEQDVLNDIRDVRQTIQNEVGKRINADGVEISVHAFPAPDHAPVQGHQFTNEEFDKMQNGGDFTDVDGNYYIGFERPIGEWNCRHLTWSILVGVTPQSYTNEQLNDILENNEKGVTIGGRHLTMYECTQRQRAYERKIRELKEGQIIAKSAGLTDLAKKYQARIFEYQKKYTTFSRECGLAVYNERTEVEGYKIL